MTTVGPRVTVYAKSTAVGANPVRPGKTYPLSVVDHAMGSHTLHLVFYYRAGPAMDRDRLKDSLSDMLQQYPPVTGRLTQPKAAEGGGGGGDWVVKCNDAGVRMLDGRADATLDEWLSSATAEEEKDLAYWEPVGNNPYVWSPFYIQITEFKDKSYAIGLSCTHMLADPNCAIFLVKAWADTHRGAFITHPPFFHPPGLSPRNRLPSPCISTAPQSLLALKSSNISSSAAARIAMSSATFRFSDAAVCSYLEEIRASCPDATPFHAIAALFWSRIAAAHVGPSALTLCIDFRKLLHAPLPHGFFGNALHFSSVRADLSQGWGQAARVLREHLAGNGEDKFWSVIEWLESRRGPDGRLPKAFPMYGPELTCVGLDKSFTYDAAFDSGEGARPVHVTCRVSGVEGEGLLMVLPSSEGGAARTVTVTLPEEAMVRICNDEAILRHGPTVMLSGRG